MPTYEYKCGSCGHRFDVFHSMSEKPRRKCPSCGKNTLQRLIGTGAAVIFKGSGFYQTDYRSESYRKAAAAEGASPTTSTPAAAEAKPAAASTAAPASESPKKEPPSKRRGTKQAPGAN